MTSVVTRNGQVPTPKSVRDSLAIHADAVLDFAPQGADMVVKVIKPVGRSKAHLAKTLKGLRGVTPEPLDEAAIEKTLASFPFSVSATQALP